MKKTLLLIILLAFTFSNAQINTQVSNYNVCDSNSDGITVFNLNTKIPEILGNLNPAIHDVTFHLTLSDASVGANAVFASSFINTNPFSQQIYVRVENSQTSEILFTSFTIVINIAPNAGTDGAATVCEMSTTVINLFSLITGEQAGGTWSRPAGTGGIFNAAAGTFSPATGATTSSFTYTVNGVAPCISDTSVATVNMTAQPNAGTDGSITVCDTSNTPIDLFSIITGEQPGGTWVMFAGAGGIFNAAAGTFTPTIGTTSCSFFYIIAGTAPCINDSSVVTILVNSCGSTCLPPTNLTTSLITNTTAILSWTSQQASTSWEILLLPYGSPTPTASSYGIITTSNPYVVTGLNPTVCYTFYVKSNCGTATPVLSDWSSPSSFCILDCTNNAQCPESLQLIAFLDSNNNGTKESNEDFFSYGNFVYNINNSGTYLYGNSNNGSFSIFDSNPSNTYNLSFTIDPSLVSYCNTSTVYSNITIPSGSASNYYYFPITQLQTYNDLEVQMVLNGNPRPGFVYYNTIYYKNKGTQTVNSGTVTFTKSPTVAINSVSQSGTTFTATGFAYNFTNLLPNEVRSIQVEMQVPTIPTVNLGDLITNSANIEPLIGDAFPNDNQSSLSQIVVGSYDPNDKIEAHGGKIDIDDFSSNDYLTYTIQFENTGSANAQFIRVEDLLNASLDPNSIKMLNSSHNYNMRRIGNQLIWNFYNINLPPTSVNPSASHGFVQFKIKPTAGFTLGDIIPNKADIYFDYNPPIITNTFETKFVQSLRNSDFNTTDFVIYPNPTNSLVTISLQNSTENINSITIINILGKKVKEIANTTSSEINVDVSNLSKGIYLVEITTESNLKTIKKLVIN